MTIFRKASKSIILSIILISTFSCAKEVEVNPYYDTCYPFNNLDTFSFKELVLIRSPIKTIRLYNQEKTPYDSISFNLNPDNTYNFIFRKVINRFGLDTVNYTDSGKLTWVEDEEPYQYLDILMYDYSQHLTHENGNVTSYTGFRSCRDYSIHFRNKINGDSMVTYFSTNH